MSDKPTADEWLKDPKFIKSVDAMLEDFSNDLGRPVTRDEIEIRWDQGKGWLTCTVCLKDWGKPA